MKNIKQTPAPVVWQDEDRLVLRLYVQPKASRDSVVGLVGDEIKIALTAPPVDGKANQHLVKYLAKLFAVARSDVRVIKGQQSRHKRIEIHGCRSLPEPFRGFVN